MTRKDETIWCDGCGIEILWAPLIVGKRDYCCEDCWDGRECRCAERMELEDDRRTNSSESAQSYD